MVEILFAFPSQKEACIMLKYKRRKFRKTIKSLVRRVFILFNLPSSSIIHFMGLTDQILMVGCLSYLMVRLPSRTLDLASRLFSIDSRVAQVST